MTTKKMIEELYKVAEQHKKDVVGVGELNIHAMCTDVANRLNELIEKQPKVGEWIPVSERLPKRQDSNNTFLRMYLVCSKRGVVHMGFRDEDGIWRTIHGNRIYNETAWMSLPEPYKGGD